MDYPKEVNPDQVITCKGCGKTDDISDWASPRDAREYHDWVRSDAYGIYTGIYCEECYNSNKYPYRKDRYPTAETDPECGEFLNDPDY